MQVIKPSSLAAPHGYNHGLLFPCGKILFVAGQIGWDQNGIMAEGLPSQFQRALQNILEVVQSAGGTVDNIGRFIIYVKDKQDYLARRKEIGRAYRSIMGKHFPAMSLFVVKDLLEEGALVEIEATAILP